MGNKQGKMKFGGGKKGQQQQQQQQHEVDPSSSTSPPPSSHPQNDPGGGQQQQQHQQQSSDPDREPPPDYHHRSELQQQQQHQQQQPSSAATSAAAPGETTGRSVPHEEDGEVYGARITDKLTVDDFIMLKVVGKGSFGKVMQVRKKDSNKIYAMKVLKKQQLVARKQVAHTQTERQVLQSIDHPFVVSLRFAFQTKEKLYMILDYFTGGELFYHLKQKGRFPENRAKFYAAEITLALECLHKHNIVYRDLKPENVLLDEDGHIRLTDFGLSKESVATGELTHTFCGTPEYLAPEVIHGGGYGHAVDWWSLGTLLYEMLTGLPPFYSQNLNVMYEKIVSAKLNFPHYISASSRSILTELLQRDPRERLGGGEDDSDAVKAHPFFQELDFEKLLRKEIPPPFKPTVTMGKLDTSNVDEEFTSEIPKDTPVPPSGLNSKPIMFPGFTFQGAESTLSGTQVDEDGFEFGGGNHHGPNPGFHDDGDDDDHSGRNSMAGLGIGSVSDPEGLLGMSLGRHLSDLQESMSPDLSSAWGDTSGSSNGQKGSPFGESMYSAQEISNI